MNALLLLVVTLVSVSLCRAGSRGNWASGATQDRDPAAPATQLTPPPPPTDTDAQGVGAAAYAQGGVPPPAFGGPHYEQSARATATGDRPATATWSERRGSGKLSVAAASSYNGDAYAAALT